MPSFFKILGGLLLFVLLALTTQIGGIMFLISKFTFRLVPQNRRSRFGFFVFNLGIYLFCTFLIVPPIATAFGRVPLPIRQGGYIVPNQFWTCLLNRHYVSPRLFDAMNDSVEAYLDMGGRRPQVRYLDANFPFIDGFPLLPHRSHDDGEKVDLAFYYTDAKRGNAWNKSVSLIGYGFCEKPTSGEQDMPTICTQKGYWQYSILDKMFGKASPDKVLFDAEETRRLIESISKQSAVKKIFIEPHLKARLGFFYDEKVRFHGCAAVRHDDHIHHQIN